MNGRDIFAAYDKDSTPGMKASNDMALRLPRLSTLHRAAAGVVAVLLGALLVYAIGGAFGVATGFAAVALRLVLTPALMAKWHPRFKDARPLSRVQWPEAHDAIDRLARAGDLAARPDLLVSPRPGMAAHTLTSPFGSAIVVGRDMLRTLTPHELAGMLAHEIGHIRNRDSYVVWALSASASLALIFVVTVALLGIDALEGMTALVTAGGWPIAVAMLFLACLAVLLEAAVRQAVESDADMTAVTLTGNPAALAAALAKGHTADRPSRFDFAGFFGSHPPVGRRIARLEALAKASSR